MPEGFSASEVGKEIAEHREHGTAEHSPAEHTQRDRWIAIFEAVLLSVVALLAAWSGYSAAKWGTESSLSLAKASSTRTKASLALIQANQVRTLDSVSFNAAETAYATNNTKLRTTPSSFAWISIGCEPATAQRWTRGSRYTP